jgi:hypothetical protein
MGVKTSSQNLKPDDYSGEVLGLQESLLSQCNICKKIQKMLPEL